MIDPDHAEIAYHECEHDRLTRDAERMIDERDALTLRVKRTRSEARWHERQAARLRAEQDGGAA